MADETEESKAEWPDVHVKLPPDLHGWLDAEARKRGVSIPDMIKFILYEGFNAVVKPIEKEESRKKKVVG